MATSNIKIGTSIYSFMLEYLNQLWSFEDCMELASLLGDKGVEVVGPMHSRCYPRISREFERQFRTACDRWELTAVSYGMYCGMADVENQLDYNVEQMKGAKKLGFIGCRIQPEATPILEQLAQVAERMKIKLWMEIHDVPALMKPMDSVGIIKKISSPYMGFCPDMGIFLDITKDPEFPPTTPASQAREKLRNQVVQVPGAQAGAQGARGGTGGMGGMGGGQGGGTGIYGAAKPAEVERLNDIMPQIMHVHGKFFYINEKGEVPGIPVAKVIETLAKGGYKGWIASEYEDCNLGTYKNSFEVVKAHQALMQRAIAKYSKA